MIVHAPALGAQHNVERPDEMQFPMAQKIGRTLKGVQTTSMDFPARGQGGLRADGPGKLPPGEEPRPERLALTARDREPAIAMGYAALNALADWKEDRR